MKKKVSLADIAKSLGVSKTLVSLVINNKADAHGISKETQQRVKSKIREMDYHPNVLARGFRMGKTNTIGLIVSDISNRFYSRIARKIEDYAWSYGYNVVICSTEEIIEKEKEQIYFLRDRQVEGMIISTSQDNCSFFNDMYVSGMPHVLIDRVFAGMKSPNVSVDNFGGARMAARHLLNQGMKKFALIAISPDHISTINERISGFVETLLEADINIPSKWMIRAPFDQIDITVRTTLQKLFQEDDLPEAIFTLNNNLTAICLKYLTDLKVKIPQQVAIIGFDDSIYFNFTRPTISSIKQPVDQLSEKAFDLLLKQIQKTAIEPHLHSVKLPVDIIIRESSIKPDAL